MGVSSYAKSKLRDEQCLACKRKCVNLMTGEWRVVNAESCMEEVRKWSRRESYLCWPSFGGVRGKSSGNLGLPRSTCDKGVRVAQPIPLPIKQGRDSFQNHAWIY